MKTRLCLAIAFFVVLGLFLMVQVKAVDTYWRDDFNYASLQEMQNAGWVLDNPSGTRMQDGGVVLDGTKADTVIRFHNQFPGGIRDWNVETRSIWLGTGHSGPGLNAFTQKHRYSIVADGWNDHFAFERDGKVTTFGSYIEQSNVWVKMSLTKTGDKMNAYYNGQLIYTYTEEDKASYELTGVERIAPWHGVMLYDYYQVSGPEAVAPSTETSGLPIEYVAIGGGVAAIVVVGAAVYFFFFSGGAASAAGGAVAGGGALGGSSGGVLSSGASGASAGALAGMGGVTSGLVVDPSAFAESVLSSLFHETVTGIMADFGYDCSCLTAPDIEYVMQHPEDGDALWEFLNNLQFPQVPTPQGSSDQTQSTYEDISSSITELMNMDFTDAQFQQDTGLPNPIIDQPNPGQRPPTFDTP